MSAIKRLTDLILGGLALLLCLPVFALIALAIRLDSPGPVLFRQGRIGYRGRLFQILKFRTMHVLEDGEDVVQATLGDPRVTRVGHVLRELSLDELPQLLNVLRGEMSLVGPRPHAAIHDDYYGGLIANYAHRRRAHPGITGWAQINGAHGPTPNLADMQARIDLDVWYVDNTSLLLDLVILARTPLVVMRCDIFRSGEYRREPMRLLKDVKLAGRAHDNKKPSRAADRPGDPGTVHPGE